MSTPIKARKKPVTIEAMQWDGTKESREHVLAWITYHGGEAAHMPARLVAGPGRGLVKKPQCIVIHTLEGKMEAQIGDYILRGVKGEFYPCRLDIFQETYEVVAL